MLIQLHNNAFTEKFEALEIINIIVSFMSIVELLYEVYYYQLLSA